MIETTVINYLKQKLNVPVYAEKPTTKPTEYVVIKLVNGGRLNYINDASIYFESISDSLFKASKLNDKVVNAMHDIVTLSNISASKLGGLNQNINTATKTYSYECVFNLIYTED